MSDHGGAIGAIDGGIDDGLVGTTLSAASIGIDDMNGASGRELAATDWTGTITPTVHLSDRFNRPPGSQTDGEEKQKGQKAKESRYKSRSQGGEKSREEGLKTKWESKK
jgi:hypothetical protein